MSVFNADTFLSSSITGANDTKFTPVPEAEYKAYVDDLKVREFEDKQKNEKVPVLDVILLIPDEKVAQLLGVEKVTVTDSMFIELDEQGNIAFGLNKNIRLGQLRDAVGQNDPKKAWSPMMLKGMGPIMIKVVHGKENEQGQKFPRVQRYAKA